MRTGLILFLAIALFFQGGLILNGHLHSPEAFVKLRAWQRSMGNTLGKALHIIVCGLFPIAAGILLVLKASGLL